MNVWHAFWKFQKAKIFIEIYSFFSAQKWMCGMLFEKSSMCDMLFGHAFWKIVHVWHAFWSCFLKNRPCVTCFLKKNRPCFLDFFKKLEIFHFIFLKLDFFSIWQVDTFFMYVENYFPNTSFIYLLDHNTLIQNIPFFYYFFYYFIFYFLFPSIHYFITFYWYYKI